MVLRKPRPASGSAPKECRAIACRRCAPPWHPTGPTCTWYESIPSARHIDGPEETWNKPGTDIAPVVEQLQLMQAKGRGVIGMKLVGDGEFQNAEDREKAARFAMSQPAINAVVIGFKNRSEVDEAIDRLNRALAAV